MEKALPIYYYPEECMKYMQETGIEATKFFYCKNGCYESTIKLDKKRKYFMYVNPNKKYFKENKIKVKDI